VIAETKGGTNPYFSTGAGGILQSVLMGFGGLDIMPNGIVQIKSVLPKNWESLKITGIGPEKKTFRVIGPPRSPTINERLIVAGTVGRLGIPLIFQFLPWKSNREIFR
jgi:hypothetical protein